MNRSDRCDILIAYLHCDDFPLITFLNLIHIQQEVESAPEQNNKRSPSDFLKAVLGRPVNVRLNTGTDYKGEKGDV